MQKIIGFVKRRKKAFVELALMVLMVFMAYVSLVYKINLWINLGLFVGIFVILWYIVINNPKE